MLLKLDHVSKSFENKQVLSDISFEIDNGEFVSIIGPSGGGKSTLLNIISNLLEPSTGRVLFQSDPNSLRPTMIFQEYNKTLFPWKNVYKNINFFLPNLSEGERKKRTQKYINLVHLNDAIGKYPSELSGGMQQRVAIARALAYEPKLLLMDEPFGSLDANIRRELELQLLDIWKMLHTTILFVTHDIDEAVFMSSRILVLAGTPATIVDDIKIKLPYPRDYIKTKSATLYNKYREQVYNHILKNA